MSPIDDTLSYAVIGFAMEAHRELGPGLDEAFYHEWMAQKLRAAGIAHQVKSRGRLVHRGIVADEFEADLIIADALVAELKVLWGAFAPEHLLQIICYLKFWRLKAGLLFDFGKESLSQKRVPFLERAASFASEVFLAGLPTSLCAQPLLKELAEALHVIIEDHGLGYRDTTYRGLLFAELKHRGIACMRDPVVAIRVRDALLGENKLTCLVLSDEAALLVTALRESRQPADRAVLQTYLRHLNLPWGLHLNFGKTKLDCQYAIKPSTS